MNIDPALVVRGDPDRLRQILVNLIGNAFKFTERGSIKLKVSIPLEDTKAHHMLFEVSDTGIGMSQEAQKKLFTRFSQVHVGGKEKYGGSGLGLTIAKELVGMMKGAINVESTIGVGTRIWFTIETERVSIEQQREANNKITHPVTKPTKLMPPQLVGRVLVAEDQPVNKTVVKSYLNRCGLESEITSDGQEALLAYFNEPGRFNLILMDCQMPIMSGLEATHKIREYEKTKNLSPITIIALTAEGRAEDREACFKVGMNDFLSKPIDLQKFNQTLAHWLPQSLSRDVLDQGTLAKLSHFDSAGVSLDMALIKDFMDSSLPQIDTLVGHQQMKANEVARMAHALKSASSTIGLIQLSEICDRIETAAEDNKDYRPLLDELDDAVPAAKKALTNYTKLKSTKAG